MGRSLTDGGETVLLARKEGCKINRELAWEDGWLYAGHSFCLRAAVPGSTTPRNYLGSPGKNPVRLMKSQVFPFLHREIIH